MGDNLYNCVKPRITCDMVDKDRLRERTFKHGLKYLSKMESTAEFPTWEIGDNLTLTIGETSNNRLDIRLHDWDTDTSYAETIDRDRWRDGDVREEIADRIARIFPTVTHAYTGESSQVTEKGLKNEIEIMLNDAVSNLGIFNQLLHRRDEIVSRTKQVVATTIDGEQTWVVELSPPDKSPFDEPSDKPPVDEPQFFGLTAEQLYADEPRAFRTAYLEAFLVEPLQSDINSARWRRLAKEWIDQAEYPDGDIENIDSLPHPDEIHEVSLDTN